MTQAMGNGSRSHGSEYGLQESLSLKRYAPSPASRPWTPAADIWYLAVRTFAWLAFACCGFAWR